MIHQLNKMIDYFIENIGKDIVIITEYKHFLLLDDKEKDLNIDLLINTYKGYPVVLRSDLPINNEFIIMTKEDYLRNFGDKE